MAAALEWRAHRPAAAAVRGDELAASSGIEPGPELGRAAGRAGGGRLRRRGDRPRGGDRARPAPAPESRTMIVDCAVYEEGSGATATSTSSTRTRPAAARRASSGSACTSRPRRSSTRCSASSTCTRSRSRTRSRRTSGRSSRSTSDMVFLVLKTARYVDPRRSSSSARCSSSSGEDFIITVRHGEASALHDVREALEGDPERLRAGPGAVLHAILDRVVDDYEPGDRGPRERHRGGRGARSSPPSADEPGASASTSSSARCSSAARDGAAGRAARPAARGHYEHDPPGDPRRTSAT